MGIRVLLLLLAPFHQNCFSCTVQKSDEYRNVRKLRKRLCGHQLRTTLKNQGYDAENIAESLVDFASLLLSLNGNTIPCALTHNPQHVIAGSAIRNCFQRARASISMSSRREFVASSLCAPVLAIGSFVQPASADVGTMTTMQYNPGETPENLEGMLGGLKPGSGRSLNALIKMRADTGVVRVGDGSPLFKPGQVLDQLRTQSGQIADVTFAFPDTWKLSQGPNLDVRDVKTSDSAFLLVRSLPPNTKFEALADDFFLDLLFDPNGKYGAYGPVEDFKVISSALVQLKRANGVNQPYRRISLKFAPLNYNARAVGRRCLMSATETGGSVFLFVTGSLAGRWKDMEQTLIGVQDSFRASGGATGKLTVVD